jgi:hypothetical protein
MADAPTPYVSATPGDLITAEKWNEMQLDVQQDIAKQVAAGVAGVKNVDHATDADKLGGMTPEQLKEYIWNLIQPLIAQRTGYMQVLCNLEWDTNNQVGIDKLIQHNLGSFPLVDLYELNYFPAICSRGDKTEDLIAEWVLFYLYHADEKRVRIPGSPPAGGAIDIETEPKFRILWWTLIEQFKEQKLLDYTDDTTLDDLEVDFWKAMFKSPPNDDTFDPDSYCHSLWFEKCCGEKRTVGDLKKHGDLDDIWLKLKPQKIAFFVFPSDTAATTSTTIRGPLPVRDASSPADTITGGGGGGGGGSGGTERSVVEVSQLDLNTIALQLLLLSAFTPPTIDGAPQFAPTPAAYQTHLPVLALMKV